MGRDDGIETREQGGYLWPGDDRHCARAALSEVDTVDLAVRRCAKRRTVVQAGGNCGVWANCLAGAFDRVVTFEPDWRNFYCLVRNAPSERITKLNAGLSDAPGVADLRRVRGNAGAHMIDPKPGPIQLLMLDALGLETVDLIVLDVEGMEERALRGGEETIRRTRPVIHLEDKGLSEAYGTPKGHVVEYLEDVFGYKVVERVARDVILA